MDRYYRYGEHANSEQGLSYLLFLLGPEKNAVKALGGAIVPLPCTMLKCLLSCQVDSLSCDVVLSPLCCHYPTVPYVDHGWENGTFNNVGCQ